MRKLEDLILDPEFLVQPMLYRAKLFKDAAHYGQTRTDGSPYGDHCNRVVMILSIASGACGYPCVETERGAIAYLHDTDEDCDNVTPEMIRSIFGSRVQIGVSQLTNHVEGERYQKIHGKPLWSVKHASLLEHCRVMHDDFKCIKIADRIDNLQESKKSWKPKRLRRYARAGWEILEAINPPNDAITQLLVEDLRKVIDSIIPLDQIDTVKIEDDVRE